MVGALPVRSGQNSMGRALIVNPRLTAWPRRTPHARAASDHAGVALLTHDQEARHWLADEISLKFDHIQLTTHLPSGLRTPRR